MRQHLRQRSCVDGAFEPQLRRAHRQQYHTRCWRGTFDGSIRRVVDRERQQSTSFFGHRALKGDQLSAPSENLIALMLNSRARRDPEVPSTRDLATIVRLNSALCCL
jgi:hypothetical protein